MSCGYSITWIAERHILKKPIWQRAAARVAGFVAALTLLVFAFRRADVNRIGHLIAAAPALLLTPGFYLMVFGFDALAWRRLIVVPGPPPRWRRLLGVRTAAEALGLSLPSGGVLAEATAVILLRKHCDVAAAPAFASLAARRFYVFLSFGLTLAASGFVGHSALAAISARMIGRPGLQWVVPVSAGFVLLIALLLRTALLGGAVAERVHRVLSTVPLLRLHSWLAPRKEVFSAADRLVESALAGRARSGRSGAMLTTALFLGIWMAESCETFFIMSLLGVGLSFREVFSFEPLLTFVRGLAFFLPSGLGLQDLGYLAVLKGLGVAHPVTLAAAFVVVKRGKEIFWITIGYVLLVKQAWQSAPQVVDCSDSGRV